MLIHRRKRADDAGKAANEAQPSKIHHVYEGMEEQDEAETVCAPWISLQDVCYSYGQEDEGGQQRVLTLAHVSLNLYPGHTYVVTGPNGCGKSTLFRVLAGLSFPENGRYLFHGEAVPRDRMNDREWSKAFYRRLGFLFQNSETQLFCKSVREEIAFGLLQLGLPKEEVQRRTEQYMDMLGIEQLAERAPFHLSGGEKKRTALAAVLAMQPQTLILDEPEAGLDEDGEAWVTEFLASLKREERLIIIATHSRRLAQAVGGEEIRMTKAHTISPGM